MSLDTLSLAAPVPVSGPAAPRRLLGVRMAGAAFDGPFNLRSAAFGALLEERDALRAERAEMRPGLLDALFAAVPIAADAAGRRRALAARRSVFNSRPVGAAWPGLAPELAATLARHDALLAREDALFDEARAPVAEERKAAAARLLADERFRVAYRYSSVGLYEAVAHSASGAAGEPGDVERGVHAYATKFISKANPFHVFAEVLFPPASGMRADGVHEVVLDMALVFALEKRLLPGAADARRVWTSLAPHAREDGAFYFWLTAPPRVAALRATPVLERLAAFFARRRTETGLPVATRAEVEADVLAGFAPEAHDDVRRHLALLAQREVLAEYLLADRRDLAPLATAGGGEAAGVLARRHLSRVSTGELEGVHAGLTAAHAALAESPTEGDGDEDRVPLPPLRYFVNSYGTGDTAPHEAAAAEVSPALAALKPCFGADSNFAAYEYVVRAFLLDFVEARGGRAPYLEALRAFLRDRAEIVGRYFPRTHRPPEERARSDAWHATAAAESGVLSAERLTALAESARALGGARETLCFNGPFDYRERVFHLSNVFAGAGHFAGRYLLHRGEAPDAWPPPREGTIDAEIATPPWRNLNLVLRHFDTGIGFEPRYAHRYARWIDPAEIVVESDGGRVAYRHEPSDAPLRVHYRGYLLSQYVPAEYQLLLVGHADAFGNPFRGSETLAEGEDFRRDAGLRHGPVSLRRERWIARAGLLTPLLREADELRFAAALRDWVHEHLAPADEWYSVVPGPGARRRKPLFLDLRSPLGAAAFRRAVAAAAPGAAVVLTRMDPPPPGLFRRASGSFVTELMIEV
jgi:hypothetical protein